MSASFTVGKIKITPIVEVANAGDVIQSIIANATPEIIKQISWLYPYYADQNGTLKAYVQSFVLEADGKKIVVDTCVGNGRVRPELAAWSDMQTAFLEDMRQAGFAPESIDMVICTHLHCDHVGWNTTFVDGKWVPTFPNAHYIFVKDEFEYWTSNPAGEIADDLNAVAESVCPISEAGLVDLVASDAQLMPGVSLIPTPGHTPHHVSIVIESDGQRAVIMGDVIHHPCQIAHPEWMSSDWNSEQALASRRKLLETFADTDTLFIGSHFAAPVSGMVVKDGDGYRLMEVTQ